MTATSAYQRLGMNLASTALVIQWIQGTAAKAEASYFKINQGAAQIDATESQMIEDRRKPNALAARALMRAGTGHKYWSAFSKDTQKQIEEIAFEVYNILFKPALQTQTIKTLDVPVAGRGYSADSFKMIFSLVNFVNRPDMWQEQPARVAKNKGRANLSDDADGSETVNYLKAVRRAASRISGADAGSLGLHPLVYFYGATGRFQPTAFLATVAFVRELEAGDELIAFTAARYRFEEFLHKNRHFVNQIGRAYGSQERGLSPMLTMYRTLLAAIKRDRTDEEIIDDLRAQSQLRSLKEITAEDRQYGRNFSAETATSVFLRDAMESAVRCKICDARLHSASISMDHITPRREGGLGSPENLQMAHFYCNSTYKQWLESRT